MKVIAFACGVNTGGKQGGMEAWKSKRRLRAGSPDDYHTDKWTAGSGSDIEVVQRARLSREAAQSERQNKLRLLGQNKFS